MEFQNFDSIIEKFREPYKLNKFRKKNFIVLEKFIKRLKNEKANLTKMLNKENEEGKYNYKIDRFFSIVNKYDKAKFINNQTFGIGNVIAIEIQDPYLNLDLIIKTILSNCRLMIIAGGALIEFNMYIVSIIQEILKEEDLDTSLISMVDLLDYKKKIVDNKEVVDCIIVNRDYDTYYFFIKNTAIKTIYLDYGNINIYADEDENEETINQIMEIANGNDMDVYTYKINNLEEFFKTDRNNFIYNTAIILSKDIKKCMKLYEVIKAQNIFINTFDIDDIEIGLDIKELQFEKRIIVKE